MVRNPDKLLNLLSLSEAPSNLNIIHGDINDIASVKRALLTSDGRLVDMVLSCIGTVPDISLTGGFNLFGKIEICQIGTRNIVTALSDIRHKGEGGDKHTMGGQRAKKPLLVVLSTTGITSASRDIPLLMVPFYHYVIAAPHEDKRAMEDYLKSSAVSSSQPWIAIRPSLLLGDGKGEHTGTKVRVGTERDGKHEELAVGYTIKREDVAYWIFQEIINGEWEDKVGTAITLTY